MSSESRLPQSASTFVVQIEELESVRRERIAGLFLLSVIVVCTMLDIIEDSVEGTSLAHITVEATVVLVCICAAVFLWRRVASSWRARASDLTTKLGQAHRDAARWREQTASLAAGLTQAIERQLHEWGLSEAEKEVAMLLVKGLSLKEIAQARSTSERTVRQQAATLYRKAGLEGRAQLAAYFLEDLFLPFQGQSEPSAE